MKELMTVGSFLNFGIESAKRNFLKFFGMIIFAVIAFIIIAFVGYKISESIGGLLTFVFAILISFGFIRNTINLTKGLPIDFKAFFSANPITLLNFFVAMIVMSILISIGTILLIIPGIILSYMLILTPFLIIDKNMGAFEAMGESMRLTKGYKMDIFVGHFVVFLLINIVSMLIITLPFTIPMALFVQIYPYLVLTGQLDKAKSELIEKEESDLPEPTDQSN
ncbi:MAG: YciC family protein [Candidatus Delongbacteria bacterium]